LQGLAVYANHLLARRVRHAGENAGFRHRGVTLVFEHTADGNAFVAKIF
jgi:hypothetical protein